MPLKIVRDPEDPFRPRVVYVPDSRDRLHGSRPQGSYYRDRTGRMMVRERIRPEREFFVGLDLGQANDFSAFAIVERAPAGLSVSYLSRVRGRPYPDIVASIAGLMARPELSGATLIVDATGVGRPVMDMLRSSGLSPLAVTITGGAKLSGGRGRICVPKRDLINAVLLAMQSGTLAIAAQIDHADVLRIELADMRARISPAGNDQYGARPGAHDDLVLALALAVWAADRRIR
ncbi:hypothetical protein KX816_09910 [Sphingosinicellaceae bacterium]|nr:hypothetical protein KX816_09910 [Sphingosinicellaceae bacterium]